MPLPPRAVSISIPESASMTVIQPRPVGQPAEHSLKAPVVLHISSSRPTDRLCDDFHAQQLARSDGQNIATPRRGKKEPIFFSCASFCDTGFRSFANGWITTSEERRAVRYTASTKPKTSPRCPKCSRFCASDFGLRSHMRSHDKTGNT